MPKTNCNIIRDLLPSYLEELCSVESKQLVEEHFEECSHCKKLYEQSTLEALYCKHAKTNASKEIDYFKSIHINVNKKNRTLLVVTCILFLIQLYLNFNAYRFNTAIASYANYIFPVLIAGTLFAVLPDFTQSSVPNKIKLPILGVQFAGMTYIFILMIFVGHNLLKNTIPFGMQAEEIGPFLIMQILVCAVCFIVTFVATLIISLRKRAICPALCFLPLGGLSLMFQYIHLLHEFTPRFRLSLFVQPFVILTCEVILLVGIYMFVNRRKQTPFSEL